MTEQLYPTYDKVLIDIKKMERKTAGGVWIPDEAAEKRERVEMRATVVRLGPVAYEDLKNAGLDHPQAGDTVLVPKYAGPTMGLQSGENDYGMRVVNPEDILAVVREE